MNLNLLLTGSWCQGVPRTTSTSSQGDEEGAEKEECGGGVAGGEHLQQAPGGAGCDRGAGPVPGRKYYHYGRDGGTEGAVEEE